MEEDRIENTPRLGCQTKGDVAEAQHGQTSRQLALDQADALQGLDGGVTEAVVAGADVV